MIYKLYTWQRDLNTDFTRKDCLFRAVTLTENDDLDKYSWFKNVIIFRLENSTAYIDNKKEIS